MITFLQLDLISIFYLSFDYKIFPPFSFFLM